MRKISIIVPVYNAEKWISETLDSLVSQTYKDTEILCVDDGSTDNSNTIIADYQVRYPQIRLIRQQNAGVCAARNNGIEHATGDYIAFMDADDRAAPETYERLISLLETEDSDIVFCEFIRFWADGHTQRNVEHSFQKVLNNPQDIKYFLLSTESYAENGVLHTEDIHGSVCRSVFKKTLLQENNIRFHTDLRFAEDQIFMLEYLHHCKKVSYTEEAYIWYRGWTKKRRYGHVYDNQMALVSYQEDIVRKNSLYSDNEKKKLIAYLRCSAYFAIVNDEFSLNPKSVERMREYAKNNRFTKLLTIYSFIQKYKARPDPKRIPLFILLKLRLWGIVKKMYPVKYYEV